LWTALRVREGLACTVFRKRRKEFAARNESGLLLGSRARCQADVCIQAVRGWLVRSVRQQEDDWDMQPHHSRGFASEWLEGPIFSSEMIPSP
jgi:hypothetical protein